MQENDTQIAKRCLKEGRSAQFLPSGSMNLKVSPESISIQYHSSEHNSQWFPGRAKLRAQGHVLKMIKDTQLEVRKQTKALTIFRQRESLIVFWVVVFFWFCFVCFFRASCYWSLGWIINLQIGSPFPQLQHSMRLGEKGNTLHKMNLCCLW